MDVDHQKKEGYNKMARFLKSSCKMSRRVGLDLNLKGIGGRNISSKCNLKVFPGQHGNKRKKIAGNYSLQLSAKQCVKYIYGVLEKQFFNYYKKSLKTKTNSGEMLLTLLESRLDNIVYRMGFSITRAEARQLVSHKSIIVSSSKTERIINIPSYHVNVGDMIKINTTSKNQLRIQHSLRCAEKVGFAPWINVDVKNMLGKYLRTPERKELSSDLNEQLIIEFYSK